MNVKHSIATALLISLGGAGAGCDTDDNNRTDRRDDGFRTRSTTTTERERDRDRSMSNRTGVTVSQEDRDFVLEAASGGIFEVESSQLALQQNLDAETTRIARMMVDDHRRINDQLKSLAQRKGITVPQTMQAKHQSQMQQLRSAAGTQFGARYHQMQLSEHQAAIALFERAARELDDAELKAFAQRTLPTLREHLDHIRQHSSGAVGGAPGDNSLPPHGGNPPRDTKTPHNENDVPDRQDLPPRDPPER